MKVAIVAGGFTPSEADALRRSMATFKSRGGVNKFEEKLIKGMTAKGYSLEYAQRIFRQLEGFGSYGFPESHAASFALLVYSSSWLKCHYPDVFACGLLNSLPMGFYEPAQIVIDARKHGVEVRPVDINYSAWDNELEEQVGAYRALRLGFRHIKGLSQEQMQILTEKRGTGYKDIPSIWHAGISPEALEKLADGDAFRSIGLDRRKALWEVMALASKPAMLFTSQPNEAIREAAVELPVMADSEHVAQDYKSMALSLKAHPVSFVRKRLDKLKAVPTAALTGMRNGQRVKVAGLVLVRQRPGTAGGVCFMTIEDETSFANLVVFKNLFEEYRKELLQSRLILAEGNVQKADGVIHVVVTKLHKLNHYLEDLTKPVQQELPLFAPAPHMNQTKQEGLIVPEARNFR